jgi:molybdopterin-guanine dinucleotide biosynthesis protein A
LNQAARGPQLDAVGFVLAGGQSNRMGRDKALVEFAGQPMVARALNILEQAGLSTFIAGARVDLSCFAPVIDDPSHQDGLGPLAGICSALAASSAQHAVFLPVDLPMLPSSLIAYMLHHARITAALVTVPSVASFAESFPCVIDRDTLPALKLRLESSDRGCFSAFQAASISLNRAISVLPVESLAQCGEISHPQGLAPSFWFLNINDSRELQRAESAAAASSRLI